MPPAVAFRWAATLASLAAATSGAASPAAPMARYGAFLFRVNRQNCPVFRSFQLRNGFVCNQFDEEVVFLDGLADLDLPRADGRLVHVFV